MSIALIVRKLLSGGGAAEPHAKELLDKTDAVITQSNTNTSNIATAQADIVTAESALDGSDDFIRGDIDFSVKGTTGYNEEFDVTDVTGTGTNVITDGKAVLTTTGAANDRESSVGNLAVFNRGDRVRFSLAIDDVTTVKFTCGLHIAANKFVLVSLNTAVDANLHLDIDDTTGPETEDLGITPVNATALDIEIWTDADGTPHVSVDGTEIVLTGITLKMTADAHKILWDVETLTTAARVLSVDWIKYKRAV